MPSTIRYRIASDVYCTALHISQCSDMYCTTLHYIFCSALICTALHYTVHSAIHFLVYSTVYTAAAVASPPPQGQARGHPGPLQDRQQRPGGHRGQVGAGTDTQTRNQKLVSQINVAAGLILFHEFGL